MPKSGSKPEAVDIKMPPRTLGDAIDLAMLIGTDAKMLADFLTSHIDEFTARSDHRHRAAISRVQMICTTPPWAWPTLRSL